MRPGGGVEKTLYLVPRRRKASHDRPAALQPSAAHLEKRTLAADVGVDADVEGGEANDVRLQDVELVDVGVGSSRTTISSELLPRTKRYFSRSWNFSAANWKFLCNCLGSRPGKVLATRLRYHVEDAVAVKADEGVAVRTAFPLTLTSADQQGTPESSTAITYRVRGVPARNWLLEYPAESGLARARGVPGRPSAA
eukprot:14974328-Heterocapsa_arctica.AAC.1